MRCLLVEDNEDFATCLTQALELEGFTVTHASNGAEGLKLMSRPWDLVLTDLHMPELGGQAMLVSALERNLTKTADIIFMSADKYELDKVRHCHTLFKPIELETLRATLNTIFGSNRR